MIPSTVPSRITWTTPTVLLEPVGETRLTCSSALAVVVDVVPVDVVPVGVVPEAVVCVLCFLDPPPLVTIRTTITATTTRPSRPSTMAPPRRELGGAAVGRRRGNASGSTGAG